VEHEVESEVEYEVKYEVKPEVKPGVESEVGYKMKPGVESEVEYEVESEVEYEVESEVEYEVEYKVKPVVEYKVKPGVEYKVKPGVEYKVKPGVEYKVKPGVESGVESEVGHGMKPEVGHGMKPEVEYEITLEKPGQNEKSVPITDIAEKQFINLVHNIRVLVPIHMISLSFVSRFSDFNFHKYDPIMYTSTETIDALVIRSLRLFGLESYQATICDTPKYVPTKSSNEYHKIIQLEIYHKYIHKEALKRKYNKYKSIYDIQIIPTHENHHCVFSWLYTISILLSYFTRQMMIKNDDTKLSTFVLIN
jgi:hypothetical protein